MNDDSFRVVATSNSGVALTEVASDLDSARAAAKTLRCCENHMVCIEAAGERLERWDRAHVTGSNRWRKVAPDAFETLGRITEVIETRGHVIEVPR